MSAPIAVIVVSWNTRELLRTCLQSLQADHEAGHAEVWVVDNASSDGSAAMVRTDFPWVTCNALAENIGYGPAVNLAAGQTDTAWVAAANSDLDFSPSALTTLLQAATRHPAAGALAPRLVVADGTTQHSVHPFPTLPHLAIFNLGLQRVIPGLGDRLSIEGYWSPDRERRVDWAHGAFLMVRRDAFEAVGGFDGEQWMYAEDLDIGWRLARAGQPTVYVPDAVVGHVVSGSTSQAFGEERDTFKQAVTYAWMAHRRGARRTWQAAAINLAGASARVAWLRVAARISPERFAWRRDRARNWAAIHRAGLRPSLDLRTQRSEAAR